MLAIHDVALTSAFMTVYKDSDDPNLFYYIPQFAEVAKNTSGNLSFGGGYFQGNQNDPDDDFGLFNFTVRGVAPSKELQKALAELRQNYGPSASLQPVVPTVKTPQLSGISAYPYIALNCQDRGGNLYTDLAGSFSIAGKYARDVMGMMTKGQGWNGQISWTTRAVQPEFEWWITANWKRVQEHFKSQVSVQYWFVKANLGYELQKLQENGTIEIKTRGGTPGEKEKVRKLAEEIAGRLFKRELQPSPFQSHPSGAALCVSLNYSKVVEDKVETWHGRDEGYIDIEMGMAALLTKIPERYFFGFDDDNPLGLHPGDGDEGRLPEGILEEIAGFKGDDEESER